MTKANLLPKFFRVDSSVKTLDIQGKEWFDKVNGNSYNSVQVVVNFGLKNEFSFSVPIQYGYGNYFEQSAFEKLVEVGVFSGKYSHRERRDSGKLIVNSDITRDCLKREVKEHGEALQTV